MSEALTSPRLWSRVPDLPALATVSPAVGEHATEECTSVDVTRNAEWIRGVIGDDGQDA